MGTYDIREHDHEWRQRFVLSRWGLFPSGYFCIHCLDITELRDKPVFVPPGAKDSA